MNGSQIRAYEFIAQEWAKEYKRTTGKEPRNMEWHRGKLEIKHWESSDSSMTMDEVLDAITELRKRLNHASQP